MSRLLAIVALLFAMPAGATKVTVVNLLDPALLDELEKSDRSLAQMLGEKKNLSRASELYEHSPRYRSFADVLAKPLAHEPQTDQLPKVIPPGSGDIPEMVRLIRGFEDRGARSEKDTKGGFRIGSLANNSHHPYAIEFDGDEPRHFDPRWLRSPHAVFKLVAIVNRIDRRDFDPATCGEVRFIYRLSYRTDKAASSMPFFLNAVHSYPGGADCAKYAKAWTLPNASPRSALLELLRSGPFADLRFKQLEVNFQSLRFTSGYMHDFGGQAMYMQRIFQIQGDGLAPAPLENTPDVLAIEKNPALLPKFVQFLRSGENLRKLDQGTLLIDFDPAFLASFSVSWSTLGRARDANKPYRRLFQTRRDLLKGIDYSKLESIKSPDALIERLDGLTCMGCHQTGGTAGFHTLGLPHDHYSHGFNRQELAFSPHGFAETLRREAYVKAVIAGVPPPRLRPHSAFPAASWAGSKPAFQPPSLGQLCLLNSDHFTAIPSCAPIDGAATQCREVVGHADRAVLFGECVIAPPARGQLREIAGSSCWHGELREVRTVPADRPGALSFNFFAFQDKFAIEGPIQSSRVLRCVHPQSGAPLGRSSRACTVSEENFAHAGLAAEDLGKRVPPELCANQGGNGFDLCAAAGDAGACLESRVVRAMLDTCSPERPCREDYICQRFPDYHRIAPADYGKKKNGKRVNQSEPGQIDASALERVRAKQIGFCVPTYFLFNMRLDGHPHPLTGVSPKVPSLDRTQPVRGYK